MPCYSNNVHTHTVIEEVRMPEDVEKINELTKLLCRATRILVKNEIQMPGQLNDWYEEHHKWDVERIKREKRNHKRRLRRRLKKEQELKERQQALQKLTDREKELLFPK